MTFEGAQMVFGRNPRAQVIEPVLEFMHRHGLGLDDLTDIGGDHLKSPVSTQRAMAARVSRCWELIARKGVNFAELVTAVLPTPAPRRRRHRAPVQQVTDNAGELGIDPLPTNPNEINDLAVFSAVRDPEFESGRPKRECA
jgi:hypothetical protein